MRRQLFRASAPAWVAFFLAACGGGSDGGDAPSGTPVAQSTARVSGLDGLLLVQDESGRTFRIDRNGEYALGTSPVGRAQALSISQRPAGQHCEVSYETAKVRAYGNVIDIECRELFSGPGPVRPGEVAVLQFSGSGPLASSPEAAIQIQGSLGGTVVDVAAGGGIAAFLVPHLSPGSHTLRFSHAGSEYSHVIETVASFNPSANAEQYVRGEFTRIENSLRSALVTAVEPQRTYLNQALSRLPEQAALADWTPPDWAAAAEMLQANLGALSGMDSLGVAQPVGQSSRVLAATRGGTPLGPEDIDFENCKRQLRRLEQAKVLVVFSGAATSAMWVMSRTRPPTSGVTLGAAVAALVGAYVAERAFAIGVSWWGPLHAAADSAIEACTQTIGRIQAWTEQEMNTQGTQRVRVAGAGFSGSFPVLFAFHHNIERRVRLAVERKMHGGAYALLSAFGRALSRHASVLPGPLLQRLQSVQLQVFEPLVPSGLGELSDSSLVASIEPLGGDEAIFTFRFSGQQPSLPYRFSYTVTGTVAGRPVNVKFPSVLHPWELLIYAANAGDYAYGPKPVVLASSAQPVVFDGSQLVMTVSLQGAARFVISVPPGGAVVHLDAVQFSNASRSWWLQSIEGPEFMHRSSNFGPSVPGCNWGSGFIGPSCPYYTPNTFFSEDGWVEGRPDSRTISSSPQRHSYYGYTTLSPAGAGYASSMRVFLSFDPINDGPDAGTQ